MSNLIALDLVYFKNFSKTYFVHAYKLMETAKNISVNIYLFKVNNENIIRCSICSKLTLKTLERRL